MLVRLRGLLGEFELRPRTIAESTGREFLHLDSSQVARMLRSALADLPDYRLRALLHDSEDPDARLDEAGLVDRLVRLIARGDLVLLRELHAGISPSEPEPPEPEDEDEVIERLDWIEVLIEDEAHQPVPYIAYKMVLPDGSTRTGTTNKLGIVRYDRIPSGTCQFTLVEVDTKAWKQV